MNCTCKILILLFLMVPVLSPAQETRQQLLFNADWKFHKGDMTGAEKPAVDDAGWRTLNLPHDWSIEGPFSQEWASGTGYSPGGIGWYRKTFTLPQQWPGKQVFIYFDGVYKNSEVWVNGHLLGKRPNGFIPFQYELKRCESDITSLTSHKKKCEEKYCSSLNKCAAWILVQ